MTLRTRIAAAAGIAVVVVAVGLTAGNLLATRRALTERIDASLREITAPHDHGPTGPGPAEPPRPPYGGPAGTAEMAPARTLLGFRRPSGNPSACPAIRPSASACRCRACRGCRPRSRPSASRWTR